MAGQCVNHYFTPIFDGSMTYKISTIALDSSTNYILEVDVDYPPHLHNTHINLPFCPTREKSPANAMTSSSQHYYDKQRYIIHYCNLQQCIRHGIRIAKIHHILQFAQWLRDYIKLNTKFRTLAKNDFEKNLYKLYKLYLWITRYLVMEIARI